jgi:hypothetical protein
MIYQLVEFSSAPSRVSMLVALLGSKGVVEPVDTEFNTKL